MKQIRKVRIEKETDSLILIRDQKNKELEKIELENINQSSQLRDKLKYDETKQNQKNLDSNINVIYSKLDSLKLFTSRDNLLDSLFKNSFIKIKKPQFSLTTRIGMLTKEFLDKELGLNTGTLTEKIKNELLNKQLNEFESKKTLLQLQDKNLFVGDFFELHQQYSKKSEEILNSLGSDSYCYSCSPTYIIVNKEVYFKLKEAGILKGNSDIQKKADKIKEDEFLLIKIKKNKFENKAIITLNEKSQFIVDGNTVYLKQDFDYNQLEYGEPISSKKLTKIKDKYIGNEIVFFNDQLKNKFLNDFYREWSLVQNFQNSILLKSSFETKLKELNVQKSLVDKKMNEIKNEISSTDYKNNSKVKKLQYEIDQLNNSINQKDDKIKKMIDDEDLRVTLIIEGDKNLEQKNYEQAISNFESAFKIRNSDDVNVKLKKAKDLYAPILAKKQEEERLARIERDRALIEETKRKEREMPTTVLHYLINNRVISASAEIQDFKMTTISSCFTVSIIRISDINSYGTKYYRDYYVDISNGYPCYEEYSSESLSQWDLEMKSNFLKKNYDYFLKTSDTEKEREQQIKKVDKYYEMYKNRASVVGCGCNF